MIFILIESLSSCSSIFALFYSLFCNFKASKLQILHELSQIHPHCCPSKKKFILPPPSSHLWSIPSIFQYGFAHRIVVNASRRCLYRTPRTYRRPSDPGYRTTRTTRGAGIVPAPWLLPAAVHLLFSGHLSGPDVEHRRELGQSYEVRSKINARISYISHFFLSCFLANRSEQQSCFFLFNAFSFPV